MMRRYISLAIILAFALAFPFMIAIAFLFDKGPTP